MNRRDLPLFRLHRRLIQQPRLVRLVEAIDAIAPRGGRMLDIGCGDGTLAQGVAERTGATVVGVDVQPRSDVAIEARRYDGKILPFESGAFDVVLVADVLHHAEDPRALMAEALRVVRDFGVLLIKDHFRFGRVSAAVLHAMDVVGNRADRVKVRGNYLSRQEWMTLVAQAGGTVEQVVWPLRIHDLPWRIVTRSEYQFLMKVRRVVV